MRLSVIIPAYNEEDHIGRTIVSIDQALREADISDFEIIVVDDDSTDNTAAIACDMKATVAQSGKRNIAATRNSGAQYASGEYFLFVDADTQINGDVLRGMLEAFNSGSVGGGALVRWFGQTRMWGHIGLWIWNQVSRVWRLPAGSFFFVTRQAFEQVGGFNEELYVSEELELAQKLKRIGRLTILSCKIDTSSRKLYQFSFWEMLSFMGRGILSPSRTIRDRKRLKIWYERREEK